MTDEVIMEAVRDGNLEKASLLFERHHKRIFNFLVRMAENRETAEDLTQNVFLRMIRYRDSFRSDSRFIPWLYQIARNVYSDHYQNRKRRYADTIDVEKVMETIPDSEDHVAMEEKEQLLHRSLAMLTEEQRELLIMTRYQHMKYEEVATVMDTTVANIKVKVHRAIGKLREHYFELAKI
jgi:RNA polymerase sigma factor (sigma-70 family)